MLSCTLSVLCMSTRTSLLSHSVTDTYLALYWSRVQHRYLRCLNSTSAQLSESEQEQSEVVQLTLCAIALSPHLFWSAPPTGPQTRYPPCNAQNIWFTVFYFLPWGGDRSSCFILKLLLYSTYVLLSYFNSFVERGTGVNKCLCSISHISNTMLNLM